MLLMCENFVKMYVMSLFMLIVWDRLNHDHMIQGGECHLQGNEIIVFF